AVQDSTDIVFSITGLSGPEAVRYDPDQDVYFVASFGESGDDPRDANGFISRVSARTGAVEALRFMTGTAGAPLHMPRGMFIRGDTLWVADVDGVHGFLRRTGRHAAFIDFTAHAPGFLNDIAVGDDGLLYVTDTGLGRVYRVRADGVAEVAVEDERTGPPNGITWDAARSAFLLAPWGGETMLRSWDPATGEIRDVVRLVGGRFDGIEIVDGAVLVASQVDSTLHRVAGVASRPLIRVPGRPADIGVDTRRGHVAVPYIALDRVDVWRIHGPPLIGLVELPGVFGTPDPDGPPGSRLPSDLVPVPLHAAPSAGSPLVATVSAADALVAWEYSADAPAAMAYGVTDGWVRVSLRESGSRQRTGWVPPGHQGTLHPLGTLLEEGLSYLTREWDGLLHDAPSATAAATGHPREGTGEEVDVNVLEVVRSGDVTWLRVEILAPGRCETGRAAVQASGWVPALAADGAPNAWFYSRGC
ncbi:MAG TPA: hypothetical protein VMM12_06640, partial [Longimicrobiales bacterium]|nr:hypothetical protein [Longimicrobiales bacterium]